MGTLPTVGDAIRRVEELGYHITYISNHPARTTRRRESLLDTPHLYCSKCDSYYTLQNILVNHCHNIYTGVENEEDAKRKPKNRRFTNEEEKMIVDYFHIMESVFCHLFTVFVFFLVSFH